jgi:serine/threonine-protein phosphatase 2B catalytic subunit
MMHFHKEGRLEKSAILQLIRMATKLLSAEPNLIRIGSDDVCFVGDIHGQFFDLHHFLQSEGQIGEMHYVFLGDYVDRGHYSVECIALLYALKVCFPKKITLLRGNHECRQMSNHFNFKSEVLQKFDEEVFSCIMDSF